MTLLVVAHCCIVVGAGMLAAHRPALTQSAGWNREMSTAKVFDIDQLRKMIRHDPQNGKLYWTDRDDCPPNVRSRIANKEAFINRSSNGYMRGAVNGVFLLAHRVIWALEYGHWPEEIDHINGIRHDNRIGNLRSVGRAVNGQNLCLQERSKSGRIGVTWYKAYKRWAAAIVVNQKRIHLGYFDTVDEAAKARSLAEQKYGFHENHGRKM